MAVSELKEGFTRRSVLAILYGAIIMQPAVLFLQLYSGVNIGGAAQYLMALLFTQLGSLLGWELTKQEVAVIFYSVGTAAGLTYFTWPIYQAYLRTGPITKAFGIADALPWFVAPPANSPAIILRNMLHPDWYPLIGTLGLGFMLGLIADMALGLIAAQLFVETEELPFPISQVEAQTIISLTEKRAEDMRIFLYATIASMGYSLILYTIPLITGFAPIPAPWFDLNYIMDSVGWSGGLLGVGTDPLYLVIGFIIPFRTVATAFVSSIIFYTVLGRFLYQMGIFKNYSPGMNLGMSLQFYILDFLASPLIGLSLALALAPVLFRPKIFLSAFKSLAKLSETARRAGYLPLSTLSAMYFVGSCGTIALTLALLPHLLPYAWVLFLLGPGWSFVAMLVTARVLGETGLLVAIPYVKEGVFVALPYSGYDIWFAPYYVTGYTFTLQPASWAGIIKAMKLTETKPSSFIKAYLYSTALAVVLSFVYASALWAMTEIPSTHFPYTAIYWPISAMYTCLWVTKRLTILNPTFIGAFFATGLALYAVSEIAHAPVSAPGFYLGAATPPPYAIMMFIGAIVGRFVFPRVLGSEKWQRSRAMIVGGILCGEAIAVALGALISLLMKSMWILPY
jgi:hypothetical protein